MQYRTIAEEPSFVEDLEALRRDRPYMDDVWRGVSWELCRRPLAYELLPGEAHIRLHPLKFREALAALLQVKPPPKGKKKETNKPSK